MVTRHSVIPNLALLVALAACAGQLQAADPAAKHAERREPARTESGALLIAPRTSDKLPGKQGSPGSASRIRPQTSGWGTVIGGLSIVVALILSVAKIVRKHVPATAGALPPEALQILGRRTLEPRQTIHLVRCAGRILVIGASQQGLSTLAEITDPVEVDYLAGLCQRSEPESPAKSFGQIFQRFRTGEPAAEEPDAASPHALLPDLASQRLKDRLQQAPAFETASASAALHGLEKVHG